MGRPVPQPRLSQHPRMQQCIKMVLIGSFLFLTYNCFERCYIKIYILYITHLRCYSRLRRYFKPANGKTCASKEALEMFNDKHKSLSLAYSFSQLHLLMRGPFSDIKEGSLRRFSARKEPLRLWKLKSNSLRFLKNKPRPLVAGIHRFLCLASDGHRTMIAHV